MRPQDKNFARALEAHQQGKLSQAETIYAEILRTNPADFDSMHMLGVIALQKGRTGPGVELIRSAIRINENDANAHSHLGNGLRELKLLKEALASYDKAIALNPHHADAFYNRGIALWSVKRSVEALASLEKAIALRSGYLDAYRIRGDILRNLKRPEEALASYDKMIALTPNGAEAYISRANALMDLKRPAEALASYDKAIALNPDSAGAYNNRGVALFRLKRLEEALASCDKAIAMKPGHAEAYNNRADALRELKRYEEALANYDEAITKKSGYLEAYTSRGNTLWELGRLQEALDSYDEAIALRPDHPAAYNNRGVALWGLKRLSEALESYDKSIALMPDYAEAYNNRGAVLLDMNLPEEALASFDKAIALKPDYAEACRNRGNVLTALKRYDEAFTVYDRLFGLRPDLMGIEGHRLNTKMHLCDWTNIERESEDLVRSIRAGSAASQPFFFLGVSSNADDQLQCSKAWTTKNFSGSEKQVWQGERYDHDRIRIAYLSADLRQHPLSFLMSGLFECHDSSRFEVTAISLASDDNSETRRRLKRAFERFIDAESYSDDEIARLVKTLQIDILVDLMGFTTNSRTGILARRSAPIQVNYLGYPGTMGASYIDYIIADRTVIPEKHRSCYSEKVVFMPDSYLVNDSKRAIANAALGRDSVGLPAAGFVFCCFNNNYKIMPHVFDCWMRILKRVPRSVLWLLENNASATSNLRKEAAARGVDAGRLIFAERMPPADHLARHRVADLCLDTLPYNAHTTAADALWAGTPVLTCLGETFVGRVAASLMCALRLSELVTATLEDYEQMAVDLALNPEKLAEINRKLANNRLTAPLFNTERLTRHIEAAFYEMVKCHRNGSLPNDILLSNPTC
jgi:protein O-GlcNAc transferase